MTSQCGTRGDKHTQMWTRSEGWTLCKCWGKVSREKWQTASKLKGSKRHFSRREWHTERRMKGKVPEEEAENIKYIPGCHAHSLWETELYLMGKIWWGFCFGRLGHISLLKIQSSPSDPLPKLTPAWYNTLLESKVKIRFILFGAIINSVPFLP